MSEGSYTEDHLVEQPGILLMQHELGWEVEAGEMILNFGCWILNGRGRREKTQRLNPNLPVDKIRITSN